jgi:hypothetical protein
MDQIEMMIVATRNEYVPAEMFRAPVIALLFSVLSDCLVKSKWCNLCNSFDGKLSVTLNQ